MCNDSPEAMVVAAEEAVTFEGPNPSPSPSPKPVDPPDKPILPTPADAEAPPPVVLSAPALDGMMRKPASVLLPVIDQIY